MIERTRSLERVQFTALNLQRTLENSFDKEHNLIKNTFSSVRYQIVFFIKFDKRVRYQRERVLFIGTQFSILYTSMYSPAEAATQIVFFIKFDKEH